MANPGTEAVLRTWLDRLWNQRDPTVIEELYLPLGQAGGLQPTPVVGPTEFRAFYDLIADAVDRTSVEVEHMMSHGNEVLLIATFRGRHVAKERDIEMRFAAHARVEDGKIVDATNILDALAPLQQLDEATPDALPRAFAR